MTAGPSPSAMRVCRRRSVTGLDPHQEAATLIALADGLMIRAMIEQEHAEATLATLNYHLDRIFTGARQPP